MQQFLMDYVQGYARFGELVRMPDGKSAEARSILRARPTLLGCWLVAGLVLSLLRQYRSTLGVWMILSVGYLFGVFVVSQLNPRYFGPVWPVFVVLLAIPADAILRGLVKTFRARIQPTQSSPV
jgi:predicted benzoate:H+ symporter BenE